MEFAILLFVVIFSLVVGFFLGILFLKSDSPLANTLLGSGRAAEKSEPAPAAAEAQAADQSSPEDQPRPETGPAPNRQDPPIPGSQLILEVWLENESELHFMSFGRTYRRDQLPEPLLNILDMESTARTGAAQPPAQPDDEPVPFQAPDDKPAQKEKVKLLSVIQEIDKILQEKLDDSPLSNKGIQLMENQHQEIRIWVGLQSYDAVDDVPDPEIRALILESVKEWEDKNG
jgi:hypothetical protein